MHFSINTGPPQEHIDTACLQKTLWSQQELKLKRAEELVASANEEHQIRGLLTKNFVEAYRNVFTINKSDSKLL